MENTKKWYLSQGTWANLIQIIVGVLVSIGLITTEVGEVILQQSPALIVSFANTVLGIWGLYGRVRATKKIG